MIRDVQTSMFPAIQPDRPVGKVIESVYLGSNADLIARLAPLYLAGSVLDVTYGLGKWWDRFRPDDLTHHDIDPEKGDGVSFLDLPEATSSIETVVFDPPYVPAGGTRTSGATQDEADFRGRFGLEPRSRAELLGLIYGGMAECCRVARSFVLAKCSDYVSGGRFWLGHLDTIDAAAQAGWTVHDLIVHHTGSGPGGHNIYTPLRARRAHSYLLVLAPK